MTDTKAAQERNTCPENAGLEREPSAECSPDDNDLGTVQISSGVIAMIARAAVLNVPGVAGLCETLAGRLAAFFGSRPAGAGIRVDAEGQCVSIGMRIEVAYGVRIPEVVLQVQNDVRRGVEGITGKTVKTVNVVVQGVKTPSKNATEDSA